ncbi:MAG: efflux RND transporter periplasmic adaptor subunit [Phycisphaerales bacterium]|nr:efflux RND transporter periplasmic adaptor subunit [Phycisphaerales bacterium]
MSTPPRRHILVSMIFRGIVCISVIVGGFFIADLLVRTRPIPATSGEGNQARKVSVIQTSSELVADRWLGYGTIRAVDAADVPVRVTAIVEEVPERIREGASVEAGELLARLDAHDYREQVAMSRERIVQVDAALERLDIEEGITEDQLRLAEKDAALVEADLNRVKSAFTEGAAVSREVDAVEQRALQAERAVLLQRQLLARIPIQRAEFESQRVAQQAAGRIAAENVERCFVRSPISGVLALVKLEVGEGVLPGQRVARVVNLDRMEVMLKIAASARGKVEIGDQVLLSRPNGAGAWSAQIDRLSPIDDPATRTMTAYAEIEAGRTGLAPGLFVRGEILLSEEQPRTILPRRAIRNQRVMVILDGRVHYQPIEVAYGFNETRSETGLPDQEWVVLEDQLPEGTLVLVEGSRTISQGAMVDPVPAKASRQAGTQP